MPTVSSLVSVSRGLTARGRQPYFVQNVIDIAAAVTANGTALVAGDIVQAITVPVNTMVVQAGIEVLTAVDGSASNDVDVLLGITGVDVDAFVASFDLDAATAGAYATSTGTPLIVGGTADTIDVEFHAGTTMPVSGQLRVWALLLDVDADNDRDADEVDRDQIA